MKKTIALSIILLSTHIIRPAFAPKMPVPLMPSVPTPIATPVIPATAPKVAPAPTKAITPSKQYSVNIAIAYDISIINTCATTATLSAITIQYTTSSAPNKVQTITTPTQTAIPAHKGISFLPRITIRTSEQNISAQFQGVTGITINSQPIKLPKAAMGTSPMYITNTNGKWKLIAKPTTKKTITKQKTTPTIPVAPKISSMQATTVPYLKTTHPKLPIMPKAPIMNRSKIPTPKKTSMAAKATTKAINHTMTKQTI